MGQHKTNPNCLLAKEGKLKPKKKKNGKKQVGALVAAYFATTTGAKDLISAMGGKYQ